MGVLVTITDAPNPGTSPAEATVKIERDGYKGPATMTYSDTEAFVSPASENINVPAIGYLTKIVTLTVNTGNQGTFTATCTYDDPERTSDDTATTQVTS